MKGLLVVAALFCGCAHRDPGLRAEPTQSLGTAASDSALKDHLAQREQPARLSRVKAYAVQHAEVPDSLLKDLDDGTLRPGMTREQVEVILGEPWSRRESEGERGRFEQWVYRERSIEDTLLYFVGGRLERWTTPQ